MEQTRTATVVAALAVCCFAASCGASAYTSQAADATAAAAAGDGSNLPTNGSPAAPAAGADPTTSATASAGNANGPATQANTPLVQLALSESSVDMDNPERGFFVFTDLMGGADLSTVRPGHSTVIYAGIRLDNYRNGPIDANFLSTLSTALSGVRAAHLKVVLRFLYNSPGDAFDGNATADAPLSVATGHIDQLQPILAANEDIIAVVQAGIIGQYGEWHDSTNNLDNQASRLAVVNALLQAVPASRSILIRTPWQKQENWGGPLNANDAFGSSAAARLGHHNDCFLASANDLGTYLSPNDMTYLAADTAYVPMAGETCAVNAPRTDCPAALADMQAYHWDMLNSDYNLDVLNGWVSQGCMDQVRKGLGYRWVLRAAALSAVASAAAAKVSYNIDVANVGFGRLYNARTVYLSVLGPAGRRDVALAGVDPRRWAAGATTNLSGEVDFGALAAGTYTVALWLPDNAPTLQPIADYAVQLANVGVWDAAQGYNVLTQNLVVQ